jgi:cholesterol transport system auxiliary component
MKMLSAASPSFYLGLFLASLVLNSGCSLKQKYPAKLCFVIEAKRSGTAPIRTNDTVVQVRSLRMAAPFQGKAFVYRMGELNYESDFYHEFLVSPQLLLTDQVHLWISSSGLFRNVLGGASRAEAGQGLEGNVSELYADFREKSAPKAVLGMQFFLMKEDAGSPQIIFHKVYRQEIAIEQKGPEAIARGWSTALKRILTDLEADLVKQSNR